MECCDRVREGGERCERVTKIESTIPDPFKGLRKPLQRSQRAATCESTYTDPFQVLREPLQRRDASTCKGHLFNLLHLRKPLQRRQTRVVEGTFSNLLKSTRESLQRLKRVASRKGVKSHLRYVAADHLSPFNDLRVQQLTKAHLAIVVTPGSTVNPVTLSSLKNSFSRHSCHSYRTIFSGTSCTPPAMLDIGEKTSARVC